MMKLGLDMLTEAAHFIENQQQDDFEPKRVQQNSKPLKENGGPPVRNGTNSESHGMTVDPAKLKERSLPPSFKDEQPASISSNSYQPPNPDQNPVLRYHHQHRQNLPDQAERMRLNDRVSGDETPVSSINHSNGIVHQQRLYSDDRQQALNSAAVYRNRSPTSPPLSPSTKRPQSPHLDSDHPQRTMVLPHPLTSLPSMAGHPLPQINPPNPMLQFLNPLMYQTAFDPAFAESFARQQAILSEVEKQTSPNSPSNPTSSSASGLLQAGLQGYMYPLATNPAYLMGARGAQQMGLADLSMFMPPHLAAYGAANLLQGQIPTLGGLSEHDKRLYESLHPGFGQQIPAHLLPQPHYKNICASGLNVSPGSKEVPPQSNPHMPAAVAAAAAASASAIPAMPGYSVEFLLKCQEALNNEAMKMKGMSSSPQSSSSPALRRSSSPETSKKIPPMLGATYPFSYLPQYLGNPSLSKSPGPERKVSTPTHKNGTRGPSPHTQDPTPRSGYPPNNRDLPLNINGGDEARRRLVALAQRPRNPVDLYPSPYKGPHDRTDRRSSSPYADRRRISRERSPSRNLSSDKTAKKRSHDASGERPRSPGHQNSVDGNRSTKSPPIHRRSSSPLQRNAVQRPSQTTNPYMAAGASGKQEKDTPPFMTSAHPYLFPQGLGAFATSPYALQSYLRQNETNTSSAGVKAAVGGFAPPVFSSANQIYRPNQPSVTDAAALAEYSRLTGIPQYAIALLMPPQQQPGFRQSVIAHATPPTSQHGLPDRSDKGQTSPVSNSSLAPRSSHAHHHAVAATSKLTGSRDSPVPQNKASKQPYPIPYPYGAPYANSRTPPVYQEPLDARSVKREASPHRRPSNLPPYKHHASSHSRSAEEEKRHKRKLEVEEESERISGSKELGVKRKREVNAEGGAADIEEHFRRSLGGKYKKEPDTTNKVTITESVDDHFQKALGGEVWSRYKSSNRSPEVHDGTERRDSVYRGDMPPTVHPTPHSAPFTHLTQTERLVLPPAPPNKPLLGGKMVKASRIVYPEAPTEGPAPASRTYSSASSGGRSDRSLSPNNKVDVRPSGGVPFTATHSLEIKNRNSLYQPSSAPTAVALNYVTSPSTTRETKVNDTHPHIDPEITPRHPTSPPSSKRGSLPPPYTMAPGNFPSSPGAAPNSPHSSNSGARTTPPQIPPREGGRGSSEGCNTDPVTVQS